MEASAVARHRQLAATSQIQALAVNSANELGKIARLELKKQLEPLRHRFEVTNQIIDGLATAVATQASGQNVFESDNTKEATRTHSFDKHFRNRDSEILASSSSLYEERKAAPTRRAVRLFTYEHFRSTVFGHLRFLITTCRTKALCMQDSSTDFRLKVDFIPRPWLTSCGLSILYSSGQDPHGYFDICP